MAWRDNLRPASFKGVPFFYEDDQLSGGRRGELHEYAQRDTPWFEDLGRKARTLSLRVYQLGANYQSDRDRLLKAIEDGAPGALVHPLMGELRLVCVAYSKTESKQEGGLVRWQLDFVEPGENVHPVARSQSRVATRRFADQALAAARTAFASRYRVRGLLPSGAALPGFLADEAGALVEGFAATAALARGLRDLGSSVPTGAFEELLADLSENSVAAAGREDLPDRLVSAVTLFAAPQEDYRPERSALRGLRAIAGFAADRPLPPASTPSRRQQLQNQRVLTGLVERAAAVEMARLSARLALDSTQDALALRDEVAGALQKAADGAADLGDDEARRALLDLRARVIEDMKARGATLAPIVRYRTARPRASLALAWLLYQDVARAGELVARNHAFHPGFMPTEGEALAR